MLDAPGLDVAIAGLIRTSLTGIGFRAIDYDTLLGLHQAVPYARPDPLYSLGASGRGGRYTPKRGPLSLYMALDQATAVAEAWQVELQAVAGQWGVHPHMTPVVTFPISFQMSAVLDVNNAAVQAALGTTAAELLAPWRPYQIVGQMAPTQVLGQRVHASRLWQGILYPSAKTGHPCLLVFPDRLQIPDYVQIIDPKGNFYSRLP